MQTRSGDPNVTKLNGAHGAPSPSLPIDNRGHNPNMTNPTSSSSPLQHEPTSSPPVDTAHTSPHLETRAGDQNTNSHIGDTRTSSSPLPLPAGPHVIPLTSTATNILSGAQGGAINNAVISVQGNNDMVVQGEVYNRS